MNLPIIPYSKPLSRLLPQRRPTPPFRRHGNKLYLLMDREGSELSTLLQYPQSSVTFGAKTYTVRARLVEDEAEAQCVMHLFRRSIQNERILRLDIEDEKSLLWVLPPLVTFSIVLNTAFGLVGQSKKDV